MKFIYSYSIVFVLLKLYKTKIETNKTPRFKTDLKCVAVVIKKQNKRLQVAYTHAHAYMWAPVPQGSQ